MTFIEFQQSLSLTTPPDGLSAALTALWHDGRGDWDRAHDVATRVVTISGGVVEEPTS